MRRSTPEPEEADEGYFASISDLMVGILFIFLLMLTIFAINYRDAQHEHLVKLQELQQTQRELDHQRKIAERALATAQQQRTRAENLEAEARRLQDAAEKQAAINAQLRSKLRQAVSLLEREIELRVAARNHLLIDLQRRLAEQGITVEIDQRSGVLHLSGDLLFATDSANLSQNAAKTVAALAEALNDALPCYAENAPADCPIGASAILETVLVEGHTDSRPIFGTSRFRNNDQLSTERALTVFAALLKLQPGLNTLRNSDGLQLLGVSGYGARRPLPNALGTTEADFRRNRRIDIRFILTSRTSQELQKLRDEINDLVGSQ